MNLPWNFANNKFVFWFILIFLLMKLSNAELTLVDSHDYLQFNKTTGESVFISEISGFKNYQSFVKNNSFTGSAWYFNFSGAFNESFLNNSCIAQNKTAESWILITPFDDSNFVNNLNLLNSKYKDSIKGVVFTYEGNPQISNPAPDNAFPKIISFAKDEIMKTNNVSSISYPNSKDSIVALSHNYYDYWYIISPAFKFYIIAIWLWGLSIILHVVWTWWLKKEHSTHLQKTLIFIPIFFLVYNLLDYIYYNSCPWISISGIQYLTIVQIALVTIFNTLFVGLCWFISKGWSIMRTTFSRDELSSITMTVGIFYLVYSAFFIASDIPSLKLVLTLVLIVMYIWVVVSCTRNWFINIKVLNSHIRITGADEILIDSLRLKKFMMINLFLIIFLFYCNKIAYNSIFTFVNDNYIWRNLIIVNMFIELVIICYMLFIFRSRKWPEYFSLDVFYQDIGNNENNDRIAKIVVLPAALPSKWALNQTKADILLNGKEIKEIKNRNFKDPELALLFETSEIDWKAIQRQSELETKCSLYSEIKLAVEDNEDDSSDTE